MKKLILFVMGMFVMLALVGCAGEGAKQLFETAQFEEVQNNKEHARELYEEIVKKYPDSEYAQKAKERLSVLTGAQ